MMLVRFNLRISISILKLSSWVNLSWTKSELDASERLLEPLIVGGINTFLIIIAIILRYTGDWI
jgi:hypothetical protein